MATKAITGGGSTPGRTVGLARPHAIIHAMGGGYKVNSPAQVDGRGREFRIKNKTDEPAYVTLPPQVGGAAEVLPGATGCIPLFSGAGGRFTYSVVMDTVGGLVAAQGNSDPVIIIDPPCA